jgi:hypothetical protein
MSKRKLTFHLSVAKQTERERDDDDYDDKEERSEQLKRFSGTSM